MGTLFKQEARGFHDVEDRHLLAASDMIIKVSEDKNLDVGVVTEIYKAEMLSRFITCFINDRNIFDEQIADVGEILQDISNSLGDMAELCCEKLAEK